MKGFFLSLLALRFPIGSVDPVGYKNHYFEVSKKYLRKKMCLTLLDVTVVPVAVLILLGVVYVLSSSC